MNLLALLVNCFFCCCNKQTLIPLITMLPIYIALLYYWLLSRLIPGLYRQWKIRKHIKAKRRLIIFSRYPVSGKTKTRLIACLGAFGAATLQLLMVNNNNSTIELVLMVT